MLGLFCHDTLPKGCERSLLALTQSSYHAGDDDRPTALRLDQATINNIISHKDYDSNLLAVDLHRLGNQSFSVAVNGKVVYVGSNDLCSEDTITEALRQHLAKPEDCFKQIAFVPNLYGQGTISASKSLVSSMQESDYLSGSPFFVLFKTQPFQLDKGHLSIEVSERDGVCETHLRSIAVIKVQGEVVGAMHRDYIVHQTSKGYDVSKQRFLYLETQQAEQIEGGYITLGSAVHGVEDELAKLISWACNDTSDDKVMTPLGEDLVSLYLRNPPDPLYDPRHVNIDPLCQLIDDGVLTGMTREVLAERFQEITEQKAFQEEYEQIGFPECYFIQFPAIIRCAVEKKSLESLRELSMSLFAMTPASEDVLTYDDMKKLFVDTYFDAIMRFKLGNTPYDQALRNNLLICGELLFQHTANLEELLNCELTHDCTSERREFFQHFLLAIYLSVDLGKEGQSREEEIAGRKTLIERFQALPIAIKNDDYVQRMAMMSAGNNQSVSLAVISTPGVVLRHTSYYDGCIDAIPLESILLSIRDTIARCKTHPDDEALYLQTIHSLVHTISKREGFISTLKEIFEKEFLPRLLDSRDILIIRELLGIFDIEHMKIGQLSNEKPTSEHVLLERNALAELRESLTQVQLNKGSGSRFRLFSPKSHDETQLEGLVASFDKLLAAPLELCVPIKFINGQDQSVFSAMATSLNVSCRSVDCIPEEIEVDLSKVDLSKGVTVTASNLGLPEGVTPLNGKNPVVTIQAPAVLSKHVSDDEALSGGSDATGSSDVDDGVVQPGLAEPDDPNPSSESGKKSSGPTV